MKKTPFRRVLSLIVAFGLLLSMAPSIHTNAATAPQRFWKETQQQIALDRSDRLADLHLDDAFEPTEIVRVSIVLEEKSTLEAGFSTLDIASNNQAMAYNKKLQKNQETVQQAISRDVLGGQVLDVVWNLTLVGNIISANVPYGKIAQIEKIDGVAGVVLENMYEPIKVQPETEVVPNQFAASQMTGFSQVWSNGYTGAGSRIAVIDTGTDTDHLSFDNGAFLYALEQNALEEGLSVEEYMAGLDLLDEEELAAILPSLNIYERDDYLTAEDLYLTEKLAFAVNYVDAGTGRLEVTHDNDYQSAHGSHVAGISTANRFVPTDNGDYVDAIKSVNVAGVAPDAQLITMKVFGNTALRDSDYMAAIEDAILLGCDSVNLSLGTTVPGYSFNDYYAELLDFMSNSDTVVVASAGNEGKWTDMTMFGTPYSDDVVYDTVGAPASYTNFFTVASVENDGVVTIVFGVDGWNFTYTDNTGYGNWPLTSIDTSADGSGTAYEYVFIDGLGYASDYDGMDLTGKVVFCSRGETNFSSKANTAVELGAVAVIIYNNTSGGFNMDLSGYSYSAPCVSIPQEYSDQIRNLSTLQTTDAGLTYYTGTIDIYGAPQAGFFNSAYYTMSAFSSWGVPGDLSIKPEITAPGGMIYSVYGSTPELFDTDAYGLMSGTSMAAPQVTGMVALLAQYMRETGLDKATGMSPRVLAQSLLMSTATPLLEQTSNYYYPVIQQGSGLARVDLATLATSYLMVDGQPDGKVKAEMGDDPQRTGVYEFSFVINNLTGESQEYALRADLFRQGIYDPGVPAEGQPYGFNIQDPRTVPMDSTAFFSVNGQSLVNPDANYDLNGDGTTNAQDADFLLEYLLGNETALQASGDINGDGEITSYDAHCLLALLSSNAMVSVPANGSVTVEVQLALTAEEKAKLDTLFPDGVFVQGFVFAEEVTDNASGTNHSIPVLAFYGNWTDPNMFDRGSYVEMWHGISDLVPYLYQVIGNGNALTIDYGDGNEYYFGGNPLLMDETYLAQRNAFNSQDKSYLKAQYFTLIRNAAATRMEIVNQQTGEVYYTNDTGSFYTSFYNSAYGVWENTQQGVNLFWTGTDANGEPLPEGTVVEVRFTAVPEYYLNADGTYDFEALGHGATMVTQLTIDNSAPVVNDYVLDPENLTLTINAKDNQYISAVVLSNKTGSMVLASATPNQTEANASVNVELDMTGVVGEKFQLSIYDYALNVTTVEIELDLPEIERPYFTAVDYNEGVYYGFDAEGNMLKLAGSDRGSTIQAVEYVDGHIFEITAGGYLFVADDNDLNSFQFIGELDPNGEWGITNFLDLAYNYADGQLYGLFYSELNGEFLPLLCTINMYTGELNVLLEMPLDVNNMAIDGEGNFYSIGYDTTQLYTYTPEGAANGEMIYIGETGYYRTGSFNSLCWDHNTDKLYWMYPNTLLEINPETGEPTLLCYFYTNIMIGLHIRPTDTTRVGMFDPIDEVWSLELDYTENRVMVGDSVALTATARPWNTTDGSVSWSSSDESIATVDENGVITGVSVGTAVITATSNLDPTMTASCVVEVMTLEKTLNGLVWDVDGKIWWSEFEISDLPNYTKLHDEAVPEYLASLAFTPDGTLYASSSDLSTGYLSSSLFTVDPETFEITKIGDSEYGYSDIAYAPHLRGGSIMGTYGSSLMVIDPTTGELYGENSYYQMFMYGLCAIAYAGSDRYQDYGFDTYIDWFFLIDTMGYVYLLGFLADDYGNLYYLDHPATNGGLFTLVSYTTDVIHFSSAHFDGDFLYWSVYHEGKDVSTLIAIDTLGSRNAYVMGDFGPGVWPAGGLCELDNPTAGMGLNSYTLTMEPKAVENAEALQPLSVVKPEAPAHNLPPVELMSNSQSHPENDEWVVVEVTTSDIATNGTMQLTYDPEALKLLEISSGMTAFASSNENGVVNLAFAEAASLPADTVVATLVFQVVENGEQTITITHDELNDGTSGEEETVTVGNENALFGDVNGDGKVNTTDAKLVMQYDLQLIDDTKLDLSVADVNGDGQYNTTDAKLIMQYDLQLIEKFPVEG